MARLIYAINTSLDGYIEDEHGAYDFLPVDDDVFAAHTSLMRSVGTHLYGRRLYENMAVWETDRYLAKQAPAFSAFSDAWQDADKVVYSKTMTEAPTARTRVEREFDLDAVRELKDTSPKDIIIGGAEVAGQALAAGLVDEIQAYVSPIVVGGGKPAMPAGYQSVLALLEERRFGNGVVLLRYEPVTHARYRGNL